jgi:hypothetical protein
MEDYGDSSHIGTLSDFRIEELRKSKYPLTSTCSEVGHPPESVDLPPGSVDLPPGSEEDSQAIPCSYKFGGSRRRYIRIPENFSEGNVYNHLLI